LLSPRYLLWLVAPLLLVWVLRNISLQDALLVLSHLNGAEILVLALANSLVLLTLSGRWWLILRAQGFPISYLTLVGYRLAAFGVTYFTPGTQFGGEPLQVYLVQRRHRVPNSTAIAAVALDKSLELFGNFSFLAGGIACILYWRLFPGVLTQQAIILPLILLAVPTGFLLSLWAGRHPISGLFQVLVRLLPRRWSDDGDGLVVRGRIQQAIRESEDQTTRFCREHPLIVAHGLGFSLLSWIGMVVEYWLALQFLGLNVTLVQAIGVLTAARVAYLLPLPAGLGALEASQVWALGMLGLNPSAGISLSLLIRTRDMILGGLGLWWGGFRAGK
jgi:uncharacterized protein (TIRG00374 family)